MSIKVGRRLYNGSKWVDPSVNGYIPIICLTKSTKYGSLGPYELTNSKGHIMENIYQFSKIYPKIPYSKQRQSRFDPTIIWEHQAEIHIDEEGDPTDDYFKWREKGMNNQYPVRYPVGYNYRHTCVGSLIQLDNKNNEE